MNINSVHTDRYTDIHICGCIHTHMHTYVCMDASTYVCMCVYIYICTYKKTHVNPRTCWASAQRRQQVFLQSGHFKRGTSPSCLRRGQKLKELEVKQLTFWGYGLGLRVLGVGTL